MESNLIIMKFGGSSVKDQKRLISVSKIIKYEIERGKKIVTVVSAQGDTTDDLLNLSKKIGRNLNPRELDVLLSAGEQISMSLLSMTLESMGAKSISLTGWQAGIKTCNCYNNARIMNIYKERILKELKNYDAIIIAGFQGINEKEDITTMGRGGSDTTAVALAAALGVKDCRIYTDVDGVYTSDPRIDLNSKKVEEISYDNMIKLADAGAQVLNKRSVRLAKKYGIEISVLSSMRNSQNSGTKVKEISFRDNYAVYTVIDENIFSLKMKSDIVDNLIKIFSNKKINIKDIFLAESYTIMLIDLENIEAIKDIIKNLDVKIDNKIAKITIICSNKDYIFENFLKVKKIISNSELKSAYVSDVISLIVNKSSGKLIVKNINKKFNSN